MWVSQYCKCFMWDKTVNQRAKHKWILLLNVRFWILQRDQLFFCEESKETHFKKKKKADIHAMRKDVCSFITVHYQSYWNKINKTHSNSWKVTKLLSSFCPHVLILVMFTQISRSYTHFHTEWTDEALWNVYWSLRN